MSRVIIEFFRDLRFGARLLSRSAGFTAIAVLSPRLGGRGRTTGHRHQPPGGRLRMALGADRPTVLWMVLREALSLVAVGTLVGLPLAFVAGRSMGALLYGVGAADPVSFAAGAVILLAVAAVAAYLPAHRASRIEPMVALGR